jgi:hypothetical protein
MSNRSVRGDSALDPTVTRLVNACNAHVINWRNAHKRGKKVVDGIVAQEKARLDNDDDEDGGRRRHRYSHQLQEDCLKLKDVCHDLQVTEVLLAHGLELYFQYRTLYETCAY